MRKIWRERKLWDLDPENPQFCCDYEYICFTNPLLIQINHVLVEINQDKVHGKKWQIGGCVKHAHVNSNPYQLKCS